MPDPYTYVHGSPLTFADYLGLCKVDLRFNRIGTNAWYHALVVVCDGDVCRGFRSGPSREPGGASSGEVPLLIARLFSGATDMADQCCGPAGPPVRQSSSPFGTLLATMGSWDPHFVDWPESGQATTAVNLMENDQPCGCLMNCLEQNLRQIDAANIPYNGITSNSNATAYTILRNCGFSPPAPPVLAPGFDYPLNHWFPR